MSSFRSQMGPLFFLVGIFFLNFLSRIILAPLMPTIEKDLKVGHDEAGSLFLMISLGFCIGLLVSGFISSRLNHRRTIILSSMAVGGILLVVSISHSLSGIRFGLVCLGMAAGLYLPSGIATVTDLVRPEHWGKAIAIHELAPNFAFVTAPLFAEALLGVCSWRGVLALIGIVSIIVGTVFFFFGKGGTFLGEAPNVGIIRTILVNPTFWIIIALFTLGNGSSFGVYTMMPLYLVAEKGMERTWVNTLISFSRISTMGVPILVGWVSDRVGIKKTLTGIFIANGMATLLLGLAPQSWIVLIVFLQPVFATSFFTPGFAALSQMGSQKIKNVAVSLTIPVGFLLGGGGTAAGIGIMGEMGSFSLGIALFGGLLFGGAILAQYLKFSKD